ncbi:MAG: arylsulfatase A-like enzyme [Rhodothermales bacterium]
MKALLAFVAVSLTAVALAGKPNIVILFADDMGYSDIGCYGSEIRTPNLDALAANGLRFSQFYNTGRCCPSRASIMTGLYSHQAGVGHMTRDEKRPGYRGQLGFDTVTIPEVLRTAGYRTMMSGKWHLGWADNNNPNTRGFDRFYGTRGYIDSYFTTIRRTEMYLDDKMVIPVTEKPVNQLFPDRLWYTTDVFTDYAMHFIDESLEMEKPFFLYLAYNAPHFPLHTKPEDLAKYRGSYKKVGWNRLRQQRLDRLLQLGLIDKGTALSPQTSPDWDSLSEADQDLLDFKMSLYAGIIDNLDQNIGRVVKKLKDSGQLDNTLIFFLSDNGASAERGVLGLRGHDAGIANWQAWGRKGGWTSSYGLGWANLSNVPFHMYKQFNHEGGISTPLIVHWPAGLKATGGITHQTGHLIDIMATCVDVAGAEYPETNKGQAIQPMAGKSLRPVLEGGSIGERKLFWEHQGNRAVRDDKWKLVAVKDQDWELIDIEADRSELNDLSTQHPEIAQRLEKEWLAWAVRVNAKLPQLAQTTARGELPEMVAISPPITIDPSNRATMAMPSFSTPPVGRDHKWSIQDNILPTGSGDKKTVHRSWWPKKGTQEWAQYDFKSPQTFNHMKVYWFHDAPNGGCKVPMSWRLLYRQADKWLPVETEQAYGVERDNFNELRFAPVKTNALRLEVTLQKGFSSGIHEWRIEALN